MSDWNQFRASHAPGDVVSGTVSKVVPFGAFVRVDGFDGLWVESGAVERGADVRVRILAIDDERERFSLGTA